MAVVATSQMISDARCVAKCVPPGMELAVLIAVLARVGNVSLANLNTLMNDAKCVAKCVPSGMMLPVLIAMVDQLNLTPTTNVGQVMAYTGSDPTSDGIVPDDPTQPATCYSLDGLGSTWYWNTLAGAWV